MLKKYLKNLGISSKNNFVSFNSATSISNNYVTENLVLVEIINGC